VITFAKSANEGISGMGMPRGMAPTSLTIRTLFRLASATMSDGMTIATSRPKAPIRVRGSRIA
jgi:hypothetical protein